MVWRELAQAAHSLRAGKAVAIPTETVYGLAARIDQEEAIRSIFTIKERPFFDPLIVHVAHLDQARGLVREWPKLAEFLAERFWPGPLTLVLPKASHVNPLITSGLESVALRMPAHPLARRLLREVGQPLAAPSANKFGRTSPTEAAHVKAEFGNTVFVVDGGACEIGLESTVARIEDDKLVILRPGSITFEMLEEALTHFSEPIHLTTKTDVASPGHLEHHYMPEIPVVIVNEHLWPLTRETSHHIQERLHLPGASFSPLELHPDPTQAARELYKSLREAAKSAHFIAIVHRSVHQGGPWTAIWDRLTRAATLEL